MGDGLPQTLPWVSKIPFIQKGAVVLYWQVKSTIPIKKMNNHGTWSIWLILYQGLKSPACIMPKDLFRSSLNLFWSKKAPISTWKKTTLEFWIRRGDCERAMIVMRLSWATIRSPNRHDYYLTYSSFHSTKSYYPHISRTKISATGNRTPVYRVTGSYTHRYTIAELTLIRMHVIYRNKHVIVESKVT